MIGSCLYLIGLRADRIHAGRAMTHQALGEREVSASQPAAMRELGHTTWVSVTPKGSVADDGSTPSSQDSFTTYRGLTASQWAARFRFRTRQLQAARSDTKRVRRTLASSPTVSEAINLAAVIYGNGSTLWALARCESTLNPRAQNASGSSGLMQFMPSTFASTPYGRFSIWSPYASALAAGWMLQQGRRSEWVC